MPAMRAYLDDFGSITIWMEKNFYGGKSDSFFLVAEDGYMKELVVKKLVEHDTRVKYEMTCPSDLPFGKDYKVREIHGLTVPLEIRMIVKRPEFNRLFEYKGNDLGATYTPKHTDFALWAPTAVSVTIQITLSGKKYTFPMERSERGVWRLSIKGNLRHALYVYFVERNGQVVRTIDPYGLSSDGNAYHSAVIDLTQLDAVEKVKPATESCCGVDAVIYEASVRDMTSLPSSNTKGHGTFSALCETGTSYDGIPTGFDHLCSLGITHVQLMPVLDFATVDEYHPSRNYNWGYDPAQYITLDGSYSSDPKDPYARMIEFRRLVSKFHAHDIRVNLDVVYNHMYDVDSSPFHRVLPYYYFRYTDNGNLSNGSYCGNDFASDTSMGRRYLIHAIETLMKIYDVDGFRFDLMGVLDVETMNLILKKARSIKKDAMIYGEGWDLPTSLDFRRKAMIVNQDLMPHIGHFNDFFRDVTKGKTSDDGKYDRGYLTGDIGMSFSILSALAGSVMTTPLFKRFEEPDQSINGAETHDNLTVWDKMHYCCSNDTREVRYQKMKMIILSMFVSQGIPFLHEGIEFCGTKKDNPNSYNSPDHINGMDWQRAKFNRHMIEYTRKCIALRKKYPEFRLHTSKEIYAQVLLSHRDDGTVSYTIQAADPTCGYKKVLVLINPMDREFNYSCEEGWQLIFDTDGNSHDEYLRNMHLPARSMLVFRQS